MTKQTERIDKNNNRASRFAIRQKMTLCAGGLFLCIDSSVVDTFNLFSIEKGETRDNRRFSRTLNNDEADDMQDI